jgi:hypothetical protein
MRRILGGKIDGPTRIVIPSRTHLVRRGISLRHRLELCAHEERFLVALLLGMTALLKAAATTQSAEAEAHKGRGKQRPYRPIVGGAPS